MRERRILRVFPRRTAYTPDDDLVRIGPPGLYDGELRDKVDEIHVSCVFTWDQGRCSELADEWQRFLSVPVSAGGPGWHNNWPAREFLPGLYVKQGVTFTSRGCPNRCPWCLVPAREGALRELPIQPGYIIQDNNLLACSEKHFASVCEMLAEQKRKVFFKGGMEAARFIGWHAGKLRQLGVKEIWFSADGPRVTDALRKAVELLWGFTRRQLRCYVLVGFDGENPAQAEARLEAVWQLGCLPFAQLYHGPEAGSRRDAPEWRALMRRWRPAVAFNFHDDDESAHAIKDLQIAPAQAKTRAEAAHV